MMHYVCLSCKYQFLDCHSQCPNCLSHNIEFDGSAQCVLCKHKQPPPKMDSRFLCNSCGNNMAGGWSQLFPACHSDKSTSKNSNNPFVVGSKRSW